MRVPLSILLARDVPYEWHDAVGIVSQLVDQARAGGSVARLPELRFIFLDEDGTLSFAPSEWTEPAMPGAARLLQQLLSGKAQPAPLRLLAMQAATPDSTPSFESFMDDLSKYERPGRNAKLRQLHSRALDQIGAPALAEAAQQLAEQPLVRKATKIDASTEPVPAKKTAGVERKTSAAPAVVVAVAVIVAAAAAGGYAWYVTHRSGGARSTPAGVADVPSERMPAGGEQQSATGDRVLPAASNGRVPRAQRSDDSSGAGDKAESELATARELLARQDYARATASFERVLEILGTDNSPQAEEIRRIAASQAAYARSAGVAYHSGDPGVIEPVPLSFLPPKPDPQTPAEQLQVLEVSIAPDGRVDSAKFVVNRPTFRNSWWTAAAKAWRFEPAMKDGHPVRFIMRIPMDDVGPGR